MGIDESGSYDIGEPLTSRIHAFVGIAGANLGLADCYLYPFSPTCNIVDGFYPGQYVMDTVVGQSEFLVNLNQQTGFEGLFRYSIWSNGDEVIKYGCVVWGENTCQIPEQTQQAMFDEYTHLEVRDETVSVQLDFLQQE